MVESNSFSVMLQKQIGSKLSGSGHSSRSKQSVKYDVDTLFVLDEDAFVELRSKLKDNQQSQDKVLMSPQKDQKPYVCDFTVRETRQPREAAKNLLDEFDKDKKQRRDRVKQPRVDPQKDDSKRKSGLLSNALTQQTQTKETFNLVNLKGGFDLGDVSSPKPQRDTQKILIKSAFQPEETLQEPSLFGSLNLEDFLQGEPSMQVRFTQRVRKFNPQFLISTCQLMKGCKPWKAQQIADSMFQEISKALNQQQSDKQFRSRLLSFEQSPCISPVKTPSDDQEQIVVRKITTSVPVFKDILGKCFAKNQFEKPDSMKDFLVASLLMQSKVNVIVLLAGTSGAGKSTLASLLGTRLGISTVLSTDSIRHIMRNFLKEEENPVLFCSTYEAGNQVPEHERKDASDNWITLKGYKQQCALVQKELAKVIDQYYQRNQSIVVEGVHLTVRFLKEMMAKYPTCIPFVLYIKSKNKHSERFAVRAKHMTIDPKFNKYVTNIQHIRTIQDYLTKKAEEVLIPRLDNHNVDRSLSLIQTTVMRCLHRISEGKPIYDVNQKRATGIHKVIQSIQKSQLSSKQAQDIIHEKVNKAEILKKYFETPIEDRGLEGTLQRKVENYRLSASFELTVDDIWDKDESLNSTDSTVRSHSFHLLHSDAPFISKTEKKQIKKDLMDFATKKEKKDRLVYSVKVHEAQEARICYGSEASELITSHKKSKGIKPKQPDHKDLEQLSLPCELYLEAQSQLEFKRQQSAQQKESELRKLKDAQKRIEKQQEMEKNQEMAEGIKESALQQKKRNKSLEHAAKDIDQSEVESLDSMAVRVEELSELEQRVGEVEEFETNILGLPSHLTSLGRNSFFSPFVQQESDHSKTVQIKKEREKKAQQSSNLKLNSDVSKPEVPKKIEKVSSFGDLLNQKQGQAAAKITIKNTPQIEKPKTKMSDDLRDFKPFEQRQTPSSAKRESENHVKFSNEEKDNKKRTKPQQKRQLSIQNHTQTQKKKISQSTFAKRERFTTISQTKQTSSVSNQGETTSSKQGQGGSVDDHISEPSVKDKKSAIEEEDSEYSQSQIGSLVSYSINYLEKKSFRGGGTSTKHDGDRISEEESDDDSLLVEKENSQGSSIDTIEEEVDISQSEGSDQFIEPAEDHKEAPVAVL